jgi:hypothetical protein
MGEFAVIHARLAAKNQTGVRAAGRGSETGVRME